MFRDALVQGGNTAGKIFYTVGSDSIRMYVCMYVWLLGYLIDI